MVKVMIPTPVVTGIAVVITSIWAVNVVVGFIDPTRHDATLNALFAIVVGGLFTLNKSKDRE